MKSRLLIKKQFKVYDKSSSEQEKNQFKVYNDNDKQMLLAS